MRAKGILKKLKHSEEQKCLWFFSYENNFDRDEKVSRRNDRWLIMCERMDPTEFPAAVMVFGVVKGSERGAHHDSPIFPEVLRVNGDADAYVETF
ncbi:hypothetical protein ACTXT7_009734 [Hymenolepis weldensis]